MFQGIYAALMTPLDESGELRTDLLTAHIEFLIDKGIDGLYVGGNSGQGVVLPVEMRKQILETVIRQSSGRIKIIAHIADMQTSCAIDLVLHANDSGADGIASLPPIFWKYTPEEIITYYREINRDSALPCMVYYIPSIASGVDRDTMLRLGDIDEIWGLKFTDSNFYLLQGILQAMNGKWKAMSGPDELFLPALTMGVIGCIGTTMNFMPELFISILNDFKSGDITSAMKTQQLVTRILMVTGTRISLSVLRSLLKLRGLEPGYPKQPMLPPDPDTERAVLDSVKKVFDANTNILEHAGLILPCSSSY